MSSVGQVRNACELMVEPGPSGKPLPNGTMGTWTATLPTGRGCGQLSRGGSLGNTTVLSANNGAETGKTTHASP